MFKRLPSALALLPALCSLRCLAASGTHHQAANAHASVRHASLIHASPASASRTHAASAHGTLAHSISTHSSRSNYAERYVPVHHDPTPSMESARATEIQTALIRAGYLAGEPSGVWDAESIAAMQKLQDENGWQTKYTPDSRALVKLGLGGASTPTSQIARAADTASMSPIAQP